MKNSDAISLSLPKDALMQSSYLPIRHYDNSNIDQLHWPESEIDAKNFLLPLIKNGTKHFIDNIDAKMYALVIDSCVVPMLVIDENYDNSFVCSPYGHYVTYALECTQNIFKQKSISVAINALIKGLGHLLRKGKVNKIIYVNNWLFPTDLYHKELNENHVATITNHLKKFFPDYAIAFKSINGLNHSQLSQVLQTANYDFIISRQVFLTNTKKEEIFQTRIFKSDLKLLRECNYKVVDDQEIEKKDLEKILNLYKKLYIDKYSSLNPQHNQNFMALIHQSNLIKLKAVKKDETICGFFGYYIRDGIMTAPLFGYEETSSEKSLYRVLSTLLTLEAKEKGCMLHQSAGASFYKKVRRAEPCMEYLTVYSKHLSFWRQLPWKFLKILMNCSARFFKEY